MIIFNDYTMWQIKIIKNKHMKFFAAFILTALLSYAAGLYLPWWSIAIAAFIVAVFVQLKPLQAFAAGFLSLFLLWVVLALFIDMNNGHLLSAKIAEVLFKSKSQALLIGATGLAAALTGGFAALTGSYVRRLKENQI
jgi:uncharacterized membrane protein YczE